jgi:type I restriction enzyme, S subunit
MANSSTTGSATEASWLYRPMFPESWDRHVLYSLATWINGMAFKNINFSPTGRPVIKIAEIKNGIAEQTQFTDSEYDRRYFVTRGALLFSWSGQPETSIDAFYWDGPDGWLNQHVFKVLPDNDVCTPSFFYYILKYLKPNFIGIARNKQTTGLGHVTKADLEAIQVAVPAKPTQDRITHVLGTLDARLTVYRRMNRTLEKMAAAIFKSWFIDFEPVHAKAERRDPGIPADIAALFPDTFEDSVVGPIPMGWKAKPLPEIIDINPKRILSKGTLAPFLEMSNMPTQGPSPVAWRLREMGSGMKFVNGDTLVARITPCLENGKTAFVDFLGDGEVGWGSTEYIVLRPRGDIPPEFAYLLARTDDFRSFAIQQMTGSSGRQRVPSDSLTKYSIVGPEIDSPIFRAFGQFVCPLFRRISAAVRQSHKIAQMRNTLLPKLLSGEIELTAAEAATEVGYESRK